MTELLKETDAIVKFITDCSKEIGTITYTKSEGLHVAKIIKALAEELGRKDEKLKDALGWKRYYEKENERQHLFLESYGRRLNAIREAYYIEDEVPGIAEWIKKHEKPQPKQED